MNDKYTEELDQREMEFLMDASEQAGHEEDMDFMIAGIRFLKDNKKHEYTVEEFCEAVPQIIKDMKDKS